MISGQQRGKISLEEGAHKIKRKPRRVGEKPDTPVDSSGLHMAAIAELHVRLHDGLAQSRVDGSVLPLVKIIASQMEASGATVVAGIDGAMDAIVGEIHPRQFSSIRDITGGAIREQKSRFQVVDSSAICAVPFGETQNPSSLIVVAPSKDLKRKEWLDLAQVGASYLSLSKRDDAVDSKVRIASQIVQIFEWNHAVQGCDTFQEASDRCVNELKKVTRAEFAALLVGKPQKTVPIAIADSVEVSKKTKLYEQLNELARESETHDRTTVYPPREGYPMHSLLAHERLTQTINCSHVVVTPFKMNDEMEGQMVCGFPEDPGVAALAQLTTAAAMPLGRTLHILKRGEPTAIQTATTKTKSFFKRTVGKISASVLLLALASLAIPLPYKIRGQCVVESVSHRFAVAPYDGIVQQGYVRPGDIVQPGDLLARMKDDALKLEIAAAEARIAKAAKEYDIALDEDDVAAALIADLERREASSELALYRYQQDQLEIRSLVEGVVFSGDLELSDNAAVHKGDVLYKVGPLEHLKIQVFVPANDIREVHVGQQMKIWLDGVSEAQTMRIERILPESQIEEDENVFVLEAEMQNNTDNFRPGMRGVARVTAQKHSLGWNLFHKPWEFVWSRVALYLQ